MPSQPIVEVSHLDFAYREQLVLKQLNLQIEQSSTLGLIGPNGAGKTSLIKLMLGLLRPTRGNITIAGLSPRDAVRRGDIIGYVPQRPDIPENFPINVRQLAQLGLVGKTGLLRSYAKPDLEFVDELLHRIGIHELANEPVGTLSGGQLQRALIARALAPRPKLLLLDEPTTGIDRAGQQRFLDSIADLKKWIDLTVVIVTHDLRFVTAMCNRVACLNVTLHYHDVPDRVPADLIYGMFACDLQALGIDHKHEQTEKSRT